MQASDRFNINSQLEHLQVCDHLTAGFRGKSAP